MAAEQRRLLALQPYDPLPGERLAAHHGVVIRTPEDLPGATPEAVAQLAGSGGWSGALLRLAPHPPIILLHPDLAPARRQSTLMHEIAHLLLQHPTVCFDPETLLPQRLQRCEDETTSLGGCLQLPRVGLVWAVQMGLNTSRIVQHFGASEKMVTFRANVTGVRLPRQ